jgi:HAD superfamily hydrolase (TIGR01458 family)
VPGALETLQYLQSHRVPHRFITNTTTQSIASLHRKLLSLGLPIAQQNIISAPYGAVLYLRQMGRPSCYLMMREEVQVDFAEFRKSRTAPDVLVVGDLDDRWSYELLNEAFGLVMNGAHLIALHKNRYWQTAQGLRLDVGPLVAALEYATGTAATLVGKPAPRFFEMALRELGLPPEQVAMVGDDIETDIEGAQRVGMRGFLVQTGKYRPELVGRFGVRADRVLGSIADLPDCLGG